MAVQAESHSDNQDDLRAEWDRAWLRGAVPKSLEPVKSAGLLRVVDLFAGCGAMSLGLKMAAESLGFQFKALTAADSESSALDVYRRNLDPNNTFGEDLSKVVEPLPQEDGSFERAPRPSRAPFKSLIGNVDILIGGPPCQGHSNLNNYSRRDDPKNSLYLVMPAMAIALKAPIVIIENVPAVVHDKTRVVHQTVACLRAAGYGVWQGPIQMVELGVAQARKRHALVAVLGRAPDVSAGLVSLATGRRAVSWAIEDLIDATTDNLFDTSSIQNARNLKRMLWLFQNRAHDLPDRLRPACHRDKVHSYVSMYGRMRWTQPAQTLTSGFGSPGQGRYIHARRRRTLTPHEAARIQFFPDSFAFRNMNGRTPRRTELAVMIGNAVPPKMSYFLGISAIASLFGPLPSNDS